jgi:hypothetical protein
VDCKCKNKIIMKQFINKLKKEGKKKIKKKEIKTKKKRKNKKEK